MGVKTMLMCRDIAVWKSVARRRGWLGGGSASVVLGCCWFMSSVRPFMKSSRGQPMITVVGYVVFAMRCWRSSEGVAGGRIVGCRVAMVGMDRRLLY